ncbi:GNAT family N-acetyltransferase [Ornithinimicrobium cerasi]|uniref:GNAT family N-acetyltransferase n=1 Tax=Ornithinimicrobium cerasi TaxID=2248773 RepID=UPI000F00C5F5|nr:GNAT family N-acetyltransferase [Ornithinimicrobium cerasi]
MSLSVVSVPPPDPGGAASPPAQVAAYADLVSRALTAILGDDDLADSASSIAVAYGSQTVRRKSLILALDGDDVVGGSYVRIPLKDNTHLAECDFEVDPGSDPGVVIPALWSGVHEVLRREGRTTVQVWSSHRADPTAEHLTPRTGVGRLPRDRAADTLRELGLVLEQVERHSVLEVAPALPAAEAGVAGAREVAGPAYRALSWVGPTPPEHLEGMAALMARMSTDAPSGELEIDPEDWDADRVAERDRVTVEMGRLSLTVAAEHVASGELVAYTVLDQPRDKPRVAYQEDTLVRIGHRGHRLGMLVKALNLQQLRAHAPDVERVHTWNAGENSHMLAINEALGFRERSAAGGWQLTGL